MTFDLTPNVFDLTKNVFNLTPNTINVVDEKGAIIESLESAGVAFVDAAEGNVTGPNGEPLEFETVDLPDQYWETLFIVTEDVARTAKAEGRPISDLLIIADGATVMTL